MHNDWTFDQPRNCAVMTLKSIAFRGAPILHFTRDLDDHGWQCLSLEDANPDETAVLALEENIDLDPSVTSLADLPPGWPAWRRSRNAAWVRELDPNASE
jgi:hypothetical protein